MKIKLIIKLVALLFCVIGTIFLNIQNMSWVYDLLSIGLSAYILILCVTLIVLALQNNLDYTLDWIFMLIGSIINIAGGLMAIIYYSEGSEKSTSIPHKYLIPIGVCALLAGSCMVADLVTGLLKRNSDNTSNNE